MRFLRKILGLPTGSPKAKKKEDYHKRLETKHRRLFRSSSVDSSLYHLKKAYSHKDAAQHALDRYKKDFERNEAFWSKPKPKEDFVHDVSVGDKYNEVWKVKTREQAAEHFGRCVRHAMMHLGSSHEEAIRDEKQNIGYYAGYGSDKHRARIEKLYDTRHPVFGAIADTGKIDPQLAHGRGVWLAKKWKKLRGESINENPHSDDELKDAVQKHGHKATKHRKVLQAIWNRSKGGSIARTPDEKDIKPLKTHQHHMIRAQKAWGVAQGMMAQRRGDGTIKRALWAKHWHPPEGYETRTHSGPWAKDYDHGEWQDKNPVKHKKKMD